MFFFSNARSPQTEEDSGRETERRVKERGRWTEINKTDRKSEIDRARKTLTWR